MLLGRRGLQVRRKTARLDSFAADKRQIRNPWTSLSTLRATTMMKNKRKFEFEVAFSFMLGPTTTPQQMRGAFFRALGVWNKNVENIVKIMLHG